MIDSTDLNFFKIRQTTNNFWKWVWHIPAPENVKFFLWTILNKFLPMRSMLCLRGMLQTNLCSIYNQSAYTTLHCLRDYEFATYFWNLLASWTHYYSKGVINMIGLDMTSMVTLYFWMLAGGCGVL